MAKKSKDVIRIDFGKEEESGGSRVRWAEGDYHVKILKAKAVRSSEKDTPGLELSFKVLDGKRKGKTFKDNIWLSPKSLRRVRLLLEAVGVKVPKKAVNLPLSKLKGKTLWIELKDDDSGVERGYSTKSVIAFEGFMSEEDYEAEPDDDEDEEDEDDYDDDDDEDEEDDEDEDEDEDEDDEDEDDDDDDEEEEAPRKKRRKSKSKKSKSKSKKRKKSKDDDDDDALDELDLEDLD